MVENEKEKQEVEVERREMLKEMFLLQLKQLHNQMKEKGNISVIKTKSNRK